MMRDYSIFEMLQLLLEGIPLEDRGTTTFEFSLIEEGLSNNIEVIYKMATQRLAHLAYYLEWGKGLDGNSKDTPPQLGLSKEAVASCRFHDFDEIKPQEVFALNRSFSSWIANQVIRDLNEYLKYFLLGVYESSLVAQYAGRSISPKDIVEARKLADKFEGGGLEDRLKMLRKSYGIKITHRAEILSLNRIRNIFAHFDGVVQRKFCNKEGLLTVSWPTNTIKIKERSSGKLILFDDVPKPFSGDEYGEVQVTWLNNPNKTEYRPNDRIQLSHSDLNELIFFYLYVVNELQRTLVSSIEQRDINLKPFDGYILQPTICMTAEE